MPIFGSQNRKALKDKDDEFADLQRLAEIQSLSPVDPKLELLDPNPNIHHLFQLYDKQFFWGKLLSVEVKWSPRMTQCAGICRYQTRSGFCTIGLSRPLLSLRPRKDLIETLLHEMIHAFLFVTHNNRDRDGHGPQFHKHMHRINKDIGSNISVYHTFHDEVRAQKVHVWRCEGPCKDRPPFHGFVRRSMNRAPGPHDLWHAQHKATCGGTFVKVLEPPGFKSKKKASKDSKASKNKEPDIPSTPKITSVFDKKTSSSPPDFLSQLPANFTPFAGTGRKLGSASTPAVPVDLSSESKVDNKATVTSSSPNKSLVGHKDISTYFTRPFLDLSSDSELYISSPPSKRKRVDPPKKESVACPICNKTGFADLNMHANICLNNQLMDSSENNSSHSSKKIKYPVSILDSSIEEIPVLKQSKTGKASIKDYLNSSSVSDHCPSALPSTSSVSSPQSSGTRGDSRTCPVCGKAVTTDMTTHLKVCIDSIPGDDNEVVILDEINQPNTSGENNKTAAVAVDFVECPICGRKFRQSMINTHLDLECLSFREFL